MLDFVDVGLGCESGYEEESNGVPLYGRHIIELQVTTLEATPCDISPEIMCRK
jgi:hypothetical protein